MLTNKEVAVKFRITPGLVCRLHRKYKNDEGFLDTIAARESAEERRIQLIVDAAKHIEQQGGGLWNTVQIQE